MAIKQRFTGEGRYITKRDIFTYICLVLLIFISAVLQTTCLSLFGARCAITLAIVCASGFIRGERAGALLGLFGGMLVDILGSSGFSLSPVLYLLCGYLCGALVGWFLSTNLPSFIVFAAIAGVLREIFTIIHYGLVSQDCNLWQIILYPVIPEYFAYLLCAIPAYGAVAGINKLFNKRNIRAKRNY